MKLYVHSYEVTGTLSFPIDMIRYDNARPASEGDSAVIIDSFEGDTKRRRVCLRTTNERKVWSPTVGRWKSFGWHVDPMTTATATVHT